MIKGTAPSPDPTPRATGEGNTPDQSPQTRRRSPRPPLIFFPNFYDYARLRVIDEFRKSYRRLILLVDLGLLNGTRLEVGTFGLHIE